MSDLDHLVAAYVSQIQRAYSSGTRGIATHEQRVAWESEAVRAIAEHDRKVKAEALKPVMDFLATVRGLNEMNVVRGLRKVVSGEESTFQQEVLLSVYGERCEHPVPKHYPEGCGKCEECREKGYGA